MDQTKQCRDCREIKPLADFPIQKGGRLGRHPLCKPCRAAQERARYQRDGDRIRGRARSDPKRKERSRWRQLERKYGLTREQFEAISAAQDHRCSICGGRRKHLRVDHDHSTGQIRGLLCDRCNLALGHFNDDPLRLRAAARYLRAATGG